jgi:hypothetical protein
VVHSTRIPLCHPHLSLAWDYEEEARRRARLNHYAAAAEAAGKAPEDMFWAPDLFESQAAQAIQKSYEDKRDLAHYRELVAKGKIQGTAASSGERTDGQEGSVYYLRVGSFIKIGWTLNIEKRMRSYPPDSVLLAAEPGTRKDEQRRHRMFAAHRTHGREWYAMTPSLMHHIEQVAVAHGAPDPVTFAARPVEIPQPRRPETIKPRRWTGRAS